MFPCLISFPPSGYLPEIHFCTFPRPGVSRFRRQPILACLTEKIKVTTLHLNEAGPRHDGTSMRPNQPQSFKNSIKASAGEAEIWVEPSRANPRDPRQR